MSEKPCPLCGREMTAIETYAGRGELYCGKCDLTIGGNEAKTPDELMKLLEQRTCEVEYCADFMGWHCKSCDTLWMGLRDQKPSYCMRCGAKVVSE